jgi:hypothetical protein
MNGEYIIGLVPERDRHGGVDRILRGAKVVVNQDENFTVVAVLDISTVGLAWGVAKRNPNYDENVPEVGVRIAATRAYRRVRDHGFV